MRFRAAAASSDFSFKRVENFFWKRIKAIRRNRDFSFRQAHRPPLFDGANFRNRLVVLADDERVARFHPFQEMRKIGLKLLEIDLDAHKCIIADEANRLNRKEKRGSRVVYNRWMFHFLISTCFFLLFDVRRGAVPG